MGVAHRFVPWKPRVVALWVAIVAAAAAVAVVWRRRRAIAAEAEARFASQETGDGPRTVRRRDAVG
jgi:hypothetical protein